MIVELAGLTFRGEVYRSDIDPRLDTVFLTGGHRGGAYCLRPVMGELCGVYEVVTQRTGVPLRDQGGRIVQAWWVGDVVEQVQPSPVSS